MWPLDNLKLRYVTWAKFLLDNGVLTSLFMFPLIILLLPCPRRTHTTRSAESLGDGILPNALDI